MVVERKTHVSSESQLGTVKFRIVTLEMVWCFYVHVISCKDRQIRGKWIFFFSVSTTVRAVAKNVLRNRGCLCHINVFFRFYKTNCIKKLLSYHFRCGQRKGLYQTTGYSHFFASSQICHCCLGQSCTSIYRNCTHRLKEGTIEDPRLMTIDNG